MLQRERAPAKAGAFSLKYENTFLCICVIERVLVVVVVLGGLDAFLRPGAENGSRRGLVSGDRYDLVVRSLCELQRHANTVSALVEVVEIVLIAGEDHGHRQIARGSIFAAGVAVRGDLALVRAAFPAWL